MSLAEVGLSMGNDSRETGDDAFLIGLGAVVSFVSGAAPGSVVVMYVHPGAEAGESINWRMRSGEYLSPCLGRRRHVRENPGKLSEVYEINSRNQLSFGYSGCNCTANAP